MGIYLNPGNKNFKDMISREIYVDKTGMISVLNRFQGVRFEGTVHVFCNCK